MPRYQGHSIPNQQKESGPLLIYTKFSSIKHSVRDQIWLIIIGLPLKLGAVQYLYAACVWVNRKPLNVWWLHCVSCQGLCYSW